MTKYFTVAAANATQIIFTDRGDDHNNSLPESLMRSEEDAQGTLRLPHSMSRFSSEQFIVQTFVNLAALNTGHHFVIRLSDQNVVTYWMTPLDA